MQPSVDFLRAAGLVDDASRIGHPLTKIRIIDATDRLIRAPETLFDSREIGIAAFGWNLPNAALAEQFETAAAGLRGLATMAVPLKALRVASGRVELEAGNGDAFTADLVVGADGKGSAVRTAAGFAVAERRFEQSALVCNLELARPLDGTSVEFHYDQGPFTLVPAGGNSANLVWIDAQATLEAARALDGPSLTALLEDRCHHLFGHVSITSPIQMFPLSSLTVEAAGKPHVLLAGESAHAFPPIGAQGLNLGLRDVADLAAMLSATDRGDPNWGAAAGADYARRRGDDLRRTGQVVDTLFRSLLTDKLPVQAMRAGGLWALKLLAGARQRAFTLGMGAR
jgi:2-octaprenyl-6-methoxyphenol hydroxylase